MRTRHTLLQMSILVIAIGLMASITQSEVGETWTLFVPPEEAREAAIQAAIEDLQTTGKKFGLTFTQKFGGAPKTWVTFSSLWAMRQEMRRLLDLLREGKIQLEGVPSPQGFEIRSFSSEDGRGLVVAGGSTMGDVYGLYWIWDRIRVHGTLPRLDTQRSPALGLRYAGVLSQKGLRSALRHTINLVSSGDILNLVPWDVEPEATRNADHRKKLQPLIDSAHSFRMDFLAVCDEISFHPVLQEEFGFELDPADPALWDALQAKYRRLLQTMPELDGVQIRTGELTRVAGDYRPFDVMHEPVESDWSIERRYRTFVQKMHEVVVGEFNKIYYHRTWSTTANEQHSDPDVYKATFTDDVPTKNLYLSPYMSLADRWYYQPYNPTFNLTPHPMVVLLATLDYHADGNTNFFPSFPGEYHQGGLQSVLSVENSNLIGTHFAVPETDDWSTRSLTAYTVFRLAWNPDEDLRQIAEDFAAIHFGREAAPTLAKMLLLSHQAYKDGVYIKPVAESIRGNTLPHIRTGTFQMRGIPQVDRGREHIEWLETSLYEPCKGRFEETLEYLDKGLRAAEEMESLFATISGKIDSGLAESVADSLRCTRLLVETHCGYVRTCFAFFQHRDDAGKQAQERLGKALAALKKARAEFSETPGCRFKFYGVDVLIQAAEEMLRNRDEALGNMAKAPDSTEVDRLIAESQTQHKQALEKHDANAVKCLRWRAKVDGRDILSIRGKSVEIEHLQSDGISSIEQEFFEPLPQKEVTVLLKTKESQEIHPFVLEQPSAANGYTAKIYLFDKPPGYGWWEIELYYVEGSPRDLGLATPVYFQ